MPDRFSEGTGRADVPLHISGFFKPVYAESPLETGSVGAGIILTPGVSCTVSRSSLGEVRLNGEPCDIDSVRYVVSKLNGLRFSLRSSVEVGVGYALSASLSLAAALAASSFAGWSEILAAQEAHVADVVNGTGLGDVSALYNGEGLVFRRVAGAPGVGITESIETPEGVAVITAELGRMETSHMLRVYADRINTYGAEAVRRFERNPTFEEFLEISSWFSMGVGFYSSRIREKLRPIRSKIMGASVKKKVLFVVTDMDLVSDVMGYVSRVFGNARVFTIGVSLWKREYPEPIRGTNH